MLPIWNDGTCPLLWWTSPSMDILQPLVVASGRASEWWISCSFLIFFGGSWAKRVWQHCFLLLFDASGSNQQTSSFDSYIFVARAAASSSSGGSPADLLLHIPPHLRTTYQTYHVWYHGTPWLYLHGKVSPETMLSTTLGFRCFTPINTRLWSVVCKKPLLSQVARNVVLGFCGVNSGRITYIFLIGWSSKRSSTPPTVSILGCYVMIFTMIGPDCNVEIARKNDMFDISNPYIPLPHCRSAKPHNLIPNILR